MTAFQARDPDFRARVQTMFDMQPFMAAIGAKITHLEPGEVDITLPWRKDLLQQHGFFHGGLTGTLADNAAGCACTSLFDAGSGPLTTEFKVNLLAPARGECLVARGRVIKSGRTLSVGQTDIYGIEDGKETHVATGLVTIMRFDGLSDVAYRGEKSPSGSVG